MDDFFNGYSLGIEVLRHEKQNYLQGGAGHTIFYKIANQTQKRIHIIVQDEFVVNENNAQFGKDFYLTGFLVANTSIIAGAFKTAGAIFLDSTCGGIKDKYKTGLSVTDETNGYNYDALFILDNGKWQLISCDVEERGKKPDKRTIVAKLKKSIERLDMFEEKLGVRLDNISIKTETGFNQLSVLGEVYSLSRVPLDQSVVVNVNLYNSDGEIISTKNSYLSKDKFLGYDTFECTFYEEEIALITNKIRVYVTSS
jgi:hypothetical protein